MDPLTTTPPRADDVDLLAEAFERRLGSQDGEAGSTDESFSGSQSSPRKRWINRSTRSPSSSPSTSGHSRGSPRGKRGRWIERKQGSPTPAEKREAPARVEMPKLKLASIKKSDIASADNPATPSPRDYAKQLSSHLARISQLERAVLEQSQEKAVLRSDLASLTAELSQTKSALDTAEHRRDEALVQLRNYESEVTVLKSNVAERREENENLSLKLESSQTTGQYDIESLRKQILNLEDDKSRLFERNSELEQLLADQAAQIDALDQAFEVIKSQNNMMDADVAEQVDQWSIRVQQLELELEEVRNHGPLEDNPGDLRAQVDELQKEYDSLRRHHDQYVSEHDAALEAANGELAEAMQAVDLSDKTVSKLKEEIREKSIRIKGLEASRDSSSSSDEANIDELREKNAEISLRCSMIEEDFLAKSKELETEKSHHQDILNQMASQMKEIEDMHRNEVEHLRSQLAEVEIANSLLKEKSATSQSSGAQSSSESDSSAVASLKERNQKLTQTVQEHLVDLRKLQSKNSTLRKEHNRRIAVTDDVITGLKKELLERENELQEAKQELEPVRSELANRARDCDRLSQTVSDSETKIAGLTRELEQVRSDLNDELAKTKAQQLHLDEARAEFQTLQSQFEGIVTAGEAKDKELTLQIAEWSEKVETAEQEAATHQAALLDSQAQLTSASNLVSEMENALRLSKAEVDELNQALGERAKVEGDDNSAPDSALQEEVSQLRVKVQEKERELRETLAEVLRIREALESASKVTHEEDDVHRAAVEDLGSELNEAKSLVETLTAALQASERFKTDVESELTDKQAIIDKLTQEVADNDALSKRLASEVTTLQTRCDSLTEENSETLTKFDKAVADLTQANRDIEAFAEKCTRLETELETATSQIEEVTSAFRAKEESFVSQIDSLSREHQALTSELESRLTDDRASAEKERDDLREELNRVKQELVVNEKDAGKFKSKLDKARQALERKNSSLSELQTTVTTLTEKEKTMKSQLETFSSVESELQDAKSKLASFDKDEMKVTVMQEELQSTKEKLSSLQDELSLAKEGLSSAQQDLSAAQEDLSSTKEELCSTKGELLSTKEELSSTQETLASAQEELSSTKAELGAKLEASTDDQALSQLQAELDEARTELSHLQKRDRIQEKLISDIRKTSEADQAALKSATQRAADLEQEVAKNKATLEDLERRCEELGNDRDRLQKKYEDRTTEVARHVKKLQALQDQYDQLESASSRPQSDTSDASARLKEKEAELVATQNRNTELAAQIETANTALESATSQVGTLSQQVEEVRVESAAKDGTISDRESSIASLRAELEAAQASTSPGDAPPVPPSPVQRAGLRAELAATRKQVDDLQEELKRVKDDKESAIGSELTALQGELKKLREENARLQLSVTSLETDLKLAKASADPPVLQARASKDVSDVTDLETLRKTIASLDDAVISRDRSIEAQTQQLLSTTAELHALRTQVSSNSESTKKAYEERDAAKDELAKAQHEASARLIALTNEIQALQAKAPAEDLVKTTEGLRGELRALQSQYSQAMTRLDQQERELSQSQILKKQHQTTIHELRAQVSAAEAALREASDNTTSQANAHAESAQTLALLQDKYNTVEKSESMALEKARSLSAEIQVMAEEKNALEVKIEALQTVVAKRDEAVVELNELVEHLSRELSSAVAEAESQRTQVSILRRDLDERAQEAQTIGQQYSLVSRDLDHKAEALTERLDELASAKAHARAVDEERGHQVERAKALEAELQQTQREFNETTNALAVANSRIDSLQQEMTTIKTAAEGVERSCERLLEESQRHDSQAREQLEAHHKSELASLKERLTELSEDNANYEKALFETEKSLREALVAEEKAKADIDSINIEHEAAILRLTQEVERLSSHQRHVAADREGAQVQLDSLQAELTVARQRLKDMESYESAKVAAEERVSQLTGTLKASQDVQKRMQDHIQMLTDDLHSTRKDLASKTQKVNLLLGSQAYDAARASMDGSKSPAGTVSDSPRNGVAKSPNSTVRTARVSSSPKRSPQPSVSPVTKSPLSQSPALKDGNDKNSSAPVSFTSEMQLLSSLNLKGKNIGVDGAIAIGESLRTNTSISILNLTRTGIADEGVAGVCAGLASNKTIHTLHLAGNGISVKGARSIAQVLSNNVGLRVLNLEWNNIGAQGADVLASALRKNSTLNSLNLAGNSIGSTGCGALADALYSNKAMTSLNLEWSNIGDEGVKQLSRVLLSPTSVLSMLNLARNGIGDAGAKALASALRSNRQVTVLDLRGNAIAFVGAESISQALSDNVALTSLNLECNNIDDNGVRALAGALKMKNSELTFVDMRMSSPSKPRGSSIKQ